MDDGQVCEAVAEWINASAPKLIAEAIYTGGGIWCVGIRRADVADTSQLWGMAGDTWCGSEYADGDYGDTGGIVRDDLETEVPSDSHEPERIAEAIVRVAEAAGRPPFERWHGPLMGMGGQGRIAVKYAALVAAFGEPDPGTDKTDAEWALRFSDGTLATIYNYKDGLAYLGERGTPVERIEEWCVGGRSAKAAVLVRAALGQPAGPFALGWYESRFGRMRCATAREAHDLHPELTGDEVALYLNGAEDGAKGDRFRLDGGRHA
jgi:hypothetical protein